jgi:hypothetical protein
MTAYDQSRVHFLELNPFGEMKEVSPTPYIAGNSTADLWSSDSGNLPIWWCAHTCLSCTFTWRLLSIVIQQLSQHFIEDLNRDYLGGYSLSCHGSGHYHSRNTAEHHGAASGHGARNSEAPLISRCTDTLLADTKEKH